jgi:rhodanese-related sulfurtransferase
MSRARIMALGALAGAGLAGLLAAALWRAPASLAPWTLDPTKPTVTLEAVEREVIRRYPIPDITTDTLARKLAAGEVLLFDVRTVAEYEAGHLPGAIRVDPAETAEGFLRAHGQNLGARPAVFYCAVGVRSSEMMLRLVGRIAPEVAGGVYNLRGGTFRWAAEGRALVAGSEPGQPHPFDAEWGQLLARTLPRP